MSGVGIQTSFKSRDGALHNVQGDTPDEYDMNLAHFVSKLPEIRAAEAAVLEKVAQSAPDGVTLLKEELGAVPIGEYDTAQGPPAAYQQTHCDRCKQAPVCKTCNRPAKLALRSIKDGQYWIHDCPSGNRDCKGQWCNLPKS